ncbi:MAG: hypothetical protein PHG24_02605 [Candidatus Pacebacteria bacterium]|nr:hypothetical protein [Candidatus Paceibacterota bacterium]
MSKQTILIMAFGLLIILSLSFFSFTYFDASKIENNSSSLSEVIDIDSFKMDYSDVLEKIGGGSFKNEYVQVSLDKNWILNTDAPKNTNPANSDGDAFFNAYQIEEDTSVPWFFIISKKDSFDALDYLGKIEQNSGEITSIQEDGSFSIEYSNGTSQKTIIIEKIIKTIDGKFIDLSLITVNTSSENAKNVFNSLLSEVAVINFLETVKFNSFEEKAEESE